MSKRSSQGDTSASSTPTVSRNMTDSPPIAPVYGLERWNNVRANWLKNKNGHEKTGKLRGEVIGRPIDNEDVIERIFSQTGNGSLREPVPLGQMIDILIDFWEADGMYD